MARPGSQKHAKRYASQRPDEACRAIQAHILRYDGYRTVDHRSEGVYGTLGHQGQTGVASRRRTFGVLLCSERCGTVQPGTHVRKAQRLRVGKISRSYPGHVNAAAGEGKSLWVKSQVHRKCLTLLTCPALTFFTRKVNG